MKLKKIIPTLHLLQKSRLSGTGCTVSEGKRTRRRRRDRGREDKREWEVGKRKGKKKEKMGFRERGSKKGKEKASDFSDGPVLTYG